MEHDEVGEPRLTPARTRVKTAAPSLAEIGDKFCSEALIIEGMYSYNSYGEY